MGAYSAGGLAVFDFDEYLISSQRTQERGLLTPMCEYKTSTKFMDVAWNPKHMSVVGCASRAHVQVYDLERAKTLNTMSAKSATHQAGIRSIQGYTSLMYTDAYLLTAGSFNGHVFRFDTRQKKPQWAWYCGNTDPVVGVFRGDNDYQVQCVHAHGAVKLFDVRRVKVGFASSFV